MYILNQCFSLWLTFKMVPINIYKIKKHNFHKVKVNNDMNFSYFLLTQLDSKMAVFSVVALVRLVQVYQYLYQVNKFTLLPPPSGWWIITLLAERVMTTKMLVNLHQSTWCYNSNDSQLHTHCCENLKIYK